VAAGIAIQNARLHQRVQEVAVYEERDRLARDLHDTVIQRLFAIGLSLQSMAGNVSAPGVADRLKNTIVDVDDTIRQVRTSIFELGSDGLDRNVRARVISLARELGQVIGFDVRVTFMGPVDTLVDDQILEHLLATIREALTNIGRHAHATRADLDLSVDGERCRLRIIDNGGGIRPGPPDSGGLGLVNLRRRAEKLHGEFTVKSPRSGGTELIWQVPIDR
jgi:signal transduction histidine kinase